MTHGATMSGTIRTFFAVDLDDATRAAASDVASALRAGPDGGEVRWVRPESLHVTLRFLGEIDAGRVPELTSRVREQTEELSPFRMRLGEPRPFPSLRRPTVVVLDVTPEELFRELAAAVERGVVAAGFAPETRAFHPHLTLGRVQRQRRLGGDRRRTGRRFSTGMDVAAPADVACDVTESVLFRSELTPSGARYTALERIPLGPVPKISITP
jgi:2'-5' RNA ligase